MKTKTGVKSGSGVRMDDNGLLKEDQHARQNQREVRSRSADRRQRLNLIDEDD